MNELQRLLAAMRSARSDGVPEDRINANIARATGGEIADLGSLTREVARRQPQGRVSSFLRAAGDIATFGIGDELGAGVAALGAAIPGGRSPGEAYSDEVNRVRGMLEGAREQHPIASGAGTVGGAFLPGGVAARTGSIATKLPGAGRAAVSGLFGAAEGAAYDVGSGEGSLSERIDTGTATSAGLGFAGGFTLRGLMDVLMSGRGRIGKDQLARLVEESTGVEGGGLAGPRRAATEQLQELSANVWQPLERKFSSVTDDAILKTIRESDELSEAARRALPSEVFEFIRRGAGEGRRAPNFRELQEIAESVGGLRRASQTAGDTFRQRRLRDAAGELHEIMEENLEGYGPARRQWAAAREAADAFDEGWSFFNKPGDQIAERLESLSGEAEENFRTGLAARLYDKLAKGGEVTQGTIDRLESAGMRSRIRQLFENESDFHAFMNEVADAGRANARDRQLRDIKRSLRWTIPVAGSAGAGGMLGGLFD